MLYAQQLQMYKDKTHRIDNRIVSIQQPKVRPVVRGKAGCLVEFGAKISLSTVDGYCSLDHFSWDNYNESKVLENSVSIYKTRFVCYPAVVVADIWASIP